MTEKAKTEQRDRPDNALIEATPEMVKAAADVFYEYAGDMVPLSEHKYWESGLIDAPLFVKPMVEAALRAFEGQILKDKKRA